MSLAVGQFVVWKRTGAVTRIRSFEAVERVQTGAVQCAVLEINRLVPLDELQPAVASVSGVPKQKRHTAATHFTQSAPLSPAVPDVEEPWFGRPDKPPALKATAPAAPAIIQPQTQPAILAAQPAPVDVLALDFMNLLVRAYHAGKPTDTHAVRSMFQTVASAVKQLRPSRLVFAMESGHDHRTKLLPEYKAHRPPQAPELRAQIELAKQAIATAGLPTFAVSGWEADDVLASICERFPCVVICSADKDLLSLHGRARVYHPWSGGAFVDPETKLGIGAGQVTDYLALCGDASDGIPGVKGIGPKTAVSLLSEFGDLEAILVAACSGQIRGTTAEKLKTQRAQALLCQQVVQLRASLPLPALDAWDPPAGYQNRLQSLGLGSVAAVLDAMRPHFLRLPQIPELPAAPQSGEALEAPAAPNTLAIVVPVAVAAVVPISTRVTCSITVAIRTGLTLQQRWEGPDHGMICCWEAGRQGRNYANPWKTDSPHWLAFDQGQRLVDLDVILTADQLSKAPSGELQ